MRQDQTTTPPFAWTILCDFDGTIALEDVTDRLLECFGRPGWETLERDWRDGRIGSRECMDAQVALLDMSAGQLRAQLEQCRIDPAFPAFVRIARDLGIPVQIASDGVDLAIHGILARHGLGDLPVAANRLLQVGARRWQLDSPFQADFCRSGTCKCAFARRVGNDRPLVLLVGDGASDYCVAERADFVFAKRTLDTHCQRRGIPYRTIGGFDDALALLPRLLAGELDDAPAFLEPAVQY